MFVKGVENEPEKHFVKQLTIDPTSRIPTGTDVIVSKNIYSESDTNPNVKTLETFLNITIEFTMQSPTWQ